MATTFKPWKPWEAPPPPPDRYDPMLDSQQAAGERGLIDYTQDAGTGNRRDVEDYGFGRSDLQRAQTRGHEDIGDQRFDVGRGYDRTSADLNTRQRYGGEDYQRNIGLLQRSYRQLGAQQGAQARVMGTAGGGALLAAARRRAENQSIDRQPLDTGFRRLNEGIATDRTRLGEDRDTSLGRLGRADTRLDEDTDTGIARLGVQTTRGIEDRNLGVQRAGREQVFLGTDTATLKGYQAAGTGWNPQGPANEFSGGPLGNRRVEIHGNGAVTIGPDGRVLARRPRRRP